MKLLPKSLKATIKHHAPWLTPIYSYFCWNFLIRPRMRKAGIEAVFTEAYRNNSWGSEESVSGTGSSLSATIAVRTLLPQVIQEFGISSLLDIPCGDFHWMNELTLSITRYIGADIVKELIFENNRLYANENRSFVTLDLTSDLLPQVDMILCRDCLFHFSFRDISLAITNVRRSGAAFFLTTTNPSLDRNRDIVTGEWRPLNLQIPPFSLPKPVMLVNEMDPKSDKHLALWRVNDL